MKKTIIASVLGIALLLGAIFSHNVSKSKLADPGGGTVGGYPTSSAIYVTDPGGGTLGG